MRIHSAALALKVLDCGRAGDASASKHVCNSGVMWGYYSGKARSVVSEKESLLAAINQALGEFEMAELRLFTVAVLHGVPVKSIDGDFALHVDLLIDAQKKLRQHLRDCGYDAASIARAFRGPAPKPSATIRTEAPPARAASSSPAPQGGARKDPRTQHGTRDAARRPESATPGAGGSAQNRARRRPSKGPSGAD